MPKTLLAVDDSATMRKALEITFSVDDYRVITAEGRASALAKLEEKPDIVIVDTFLDPDDGYALAKEIRSRNSSALIVMLFSSRFHPYDAAKAADAGADESMDKPFDTQQFLDKVKNGLAAKAAALTAKPPATASAAVPPAAAAMPAPAPRTHTIVDSPAPAPKPAPLSAATTPAPAAAKTSPPPAVAPLSASTPQPARAPAAIPADFSAKLGQLGLTQAQMDGVLSLSRDVIERVVWEVVPTLAELLIKEEISRLTRDA